ncbi:MAG: hypothetical protein PVI86_18480 [Phycisphaerae bacterium]
MKSLNRMVFAGACACAMWVSAPVRAGNEDLAMLLEVMPSDFPMAVVVQNMSDLDGKISGIEKRFDPASQDPTLVAQIKSEVGIGEWADFNKPMGVGVPAFGGAEWQGVLWLWVDNFAGRVAGHTGAKETDGTWTLPFEGMETLLARPQGKYVAVTNTPEVMNRVMKGGAPLKAQDAGMSKLLDGRDVWVHFKMDPARKHVLAHVTQFAQMAPMMAMMAGAQGGADTAALTGMLTGVMDAVKAYAEQIDTFDAVVGVNASALDITLATRYTEGAIRSYLTKQKPASGPLLRHLEDQPYLVALAYEVPGENSPFFDYMIGRMGSAIIAAPQAGTDAAGQENVKQALAGMRDLFTKLEGQDVVVGASGGGMRVIGDYVGRDASELFEAVKKSFLLPNPLMNQLKAGAMYEPAGSKTIGNVNVEEFALKVDTTNPQAAQMLAMYGGNPRLALGIVGDRVRYCMGSEFPLHQVFASQVVKPFASNDHVRKALAALPTRRNAVLLIDPAGALPVVAPLMGKPVGEPVPPGPPVALSVSLAGEPARVDIHVPFEAIERAMKAFEGNQTP